jgi:hypothetical protein
MAMFEKKNFVQSDETRDFKYGQFDLVTVGGMTFGRSIFYPGWRWSTCMRSVEKTQWCEIPHLQYHLSGQLRVLLEDGTELQFGPGDVAWIPPRHDAWVVGNDRVAVIDIGGSVASIARPA